MSTGFAIGVCTDCRDYMLNGGSATDEADARHERGIAGLAALGLHVRILNKPNRKGFIYGRETEQNCDICDAFGGVHWDALALEIGA